MEGRSIFFKTSEKASESTTKWHPYAMGTVGQAVSVTDEYKQGAGGEFVAHSINARPILDASYNNGLVSALLRAYNEHHDLVLRPENFWIAILTQFSNYVNANAEALRPKLVPHEGTKELTVYGTQIASMMLDMTTQIAANLKDASVVDWVMPDFTTTTPCDRVVCGVTLMATMQKYFSYTACCLCGIPSVTLQGTTADYMHLARKVDRLLEFDNGTGVIKKWHEFLQPIFAELVRASQGNHNPEFWSRVCSTHSEGSGSSCLSGWITAFCCFTDKGKWQGDNRIYEAWNAVERTSTTVHSDYPIVDTSNIPSGMVSVPVKLIYPGGEEHMTKMFAGSFAMDTVGECGLAPRLDWAMAIVDESKF